MTAELDKVHIEPLDLDNYQVWSSKMKFLLVTKGLWSAVRPAAGAVVPPDVSDKAIAVIGLNVKEHHLSTVNDAASAEALWTTLQQGYQARALPRMLQLRQQLTTLKKVPGEAVPKYIARAKELWRDLVACGANVTEQDVVIAVLAGLSKEYETLVTVLEANNQALTLDSLLPRLLVVENRLGRAEEETKALLTAQHQARVYKKGKGQGRDKSWGKGNGKGKTKGTCWGCGQPGHHRSECPRDAKPVGQNSHDKKPLAFMVTEGLNLDDGMQALVIDSDDEEDLMGPVAVVAAAGGACDCGLWQSGHCNCCGCGQGGSDPDNSLAQCSPCARPVGKPGVCQTGNSQGHSGHL